jgi:PEGA domain
MSPHLRVASALSTLLLVGFVWGALAERAAAQGLRGAVVYTTTPDAEALATRAADRLEAALAARGRPVVSMHDARDRLRAQSREPVPLAPDDRATVASEAHASLEHVAFGRNAAARRSVEDVLRRAERTLEALNRDTESARHVLDACLTLVRSALAKNDRSAALTETMRCRRLVPDVAPSEAAHPPTVTGVLAEADEQLRRLHVGRLSVESAPESGCAVYVNGRHLGTTPFSLDHAAAGEYRVQVECGAAPGRVHTVLLGDQPAALRVDLELDRALRDGGRVALVYADDARLRARAEAHAGALGRALRVDTVLVVTPRGEQVIVSQLGVAQARLSGRTVLPASAFEVPGDARVAGALDALAAGKLDPEPEPVSAQGAVVEAQPVATAPEPRPSVEVAAPALPALEAPSHPLRPWRIAAASSAVAGLGLLVTGALFDRSYRDAAGQLEAINNDDTTEVVSAGPLNEDYDRGRDLRWLALPGGVLLTAAVPLARIDVSAGVPWWSYGAGAAGLGLAVWGVVESAQHGSCSRRNNEQVCIVHEVSGSKGRVLFAAAAPLLALPITHLVAWRLGKRAPQVSAELGPGSARVTLGGRFRGL